MALSDCEGDLPSPQQVRGVDRNTLQVFCLRRGRLEVGTETSPDRSKSVKSHLMPVFTAAGNHSVQVSVWPGCLAGPNARCENIFCGLHAQFDTLNEQSGQ